MTPAGYLVTMNKFVDPTTVLEQPENKVIKIFTKISKLLNFRITRNSIVIYECNITQLLWISEMLIAHYGPISFLKLSGVKDIVITDEQGKAKVCNIYHLQHHGKEIYGSHTIEQIEQESSDTVIMFSCLSTSLLVDKLKNVGIVTNVSATVLSNQMDMYDWDRLVTSEI